MDMNKVWLSGLAVTQPVLTKLESKTPFTTFTLQINEQFTDKHGVMRVKPNLIRVESLGRSAHSTAKKVQKHMRYFVDGYLRQDPGDTGDYVRVRSFAIYKEDSADTTHYLEGLKQALSVLNKSRDIRAAVSTLEELIHAQ